MSVDVPPLGPVHAISRAQTAQRRAGMRAVVHARTPGKEPRTCCGRSIHTTSALQPPPDAPIDCRPCRQIVALVRDRETRGLGPLCLTWTRGWFGRADTLCMQPVDGHRKRPDLGYDALWHDGYDLPDYYDDGDEPE